MTASQTEIIFSNECCHISERIENILDIKCNIRKKYVSSVTPSQY